MKQYKRLYAVFFAFVLIFSLIISSCDESNLDVEPYSVTESSYYKNDNQFLKAIIGVYAKLTDIYYFNNNTPCHHIWLLPGDDLTSTGDYSSESFSGLIASDDRLNDIWEAYYQIISRANIILQKIEEAVDDETIDITYETSEYIKGEALFLKSLMYYKLWNMWGTAPLVKERITSLDETNTPNSTGTELLDQAISDLSDAAELLPVTWDETYTGRVTSEAAYGLLGKCLVFRANYNYSNDASSSQADYQLAIAAFDKITTRMLVPNFGDNFSCETENNVESLFEFQASIQSGFENVWLSNDFNLSVGSMHAYWGFFNMEWSFWAKTPFVPTQKIIDAFESEDPRIAYTYEMADIATYPSGYRWLKYVLNEGALNMTGSLNNPRILRYADILLLEAEAVLLSGGEPSEAIQLINRVRKRAREMVSGGIVPADYSTSETNIEIIMQWIMNERFLELSGEDDHRWFDLKRWSYAGLMDLATWDSGNSGFGSLRSDFNFTEFFSETQGKMLYPIPSNEIDRNDNISQNPGY